MIAVKKKVKHLRPVGEMVLIRQDPEQEKTSGGIILPDRSKVETLTGIIVAMPERMKEDSLEYPFEEEDRVIYDIRYQIPIDLSPGNKYHLVEAQYIYGVLTEEEIEE